MEVWNIVFFCIALNHAECMSAFPPTNGSVWGLQCCGPFKYLSEEQCVKTAEAIANSFYNEYKYRLEYACRRQKDDEVYVPSRRQ